MGGWVGKGRWKGEEGRGMHFKGVKGRGRDRSKESGRPDEVLVASLVAERSGAGWAASLEARK